MLIFLTIENNKIGVYLHIILNMPLITIYLNLTIIKPMSRY